MAIQNIIAGGFYGKLGEVVGQRWRNIRTVRTHVIPENPRTEAQQANRAQFAVATALAKEAFTTNRGEDYWQRPDMGQFSWMVSTAKTRLQLGMSLADALPLYPDNFVPSFTLDNVTVDYSLWPLQLTMQDITTTFTTTREMEIMITAWNIANARMETQHIRTTIAAGGFFIHTWYAQHEWELRAESNAQATSLWNTLNAGQSIWMPPVPLAAV